MPNFIPARGRTLHVAGVCINRIGTDWTSFRYVVTAAIGIAPSLLFIFKINQERDVELTHVEVFEDF